MCLLFVENWPTVFNPFYKTFSSRYTYLLLNICSEIDSIAEEYCKVVKAPSKVKNILQKMTVIVNDDPKIKDQRVSTKYPYEIINFVPFAGFDSESAAGWWQDYKLVKHFRADVPEKGIPNYQLAHLKNVMNALAALYILCQNLYKLLGESNLQLEPSRLFE